MAKGKKLLFVTGLLEVIIGAASIALISWILGQDPGSFTFYGVDAANLAKDALWTLVAIYATSAIQIIAGLLGIIYSNNPKHAGICKFFGVILIAIAIFNFTHGHGNITTMTSLVNAVALLVPVFYFYGAIQNKNSN